VSVQRLALVAALFSMFAPPLRAANRLEKAKEHAARAKVHYDLGEYQQAAREYILVYRFKPLPALLYNIAQSYRQAGQYELARQFYRSYQREVHDGERSAMVERAIADIDELLANQRRAKDRPPNGVAQNLGTLSSQTKPLAPRPQSPAMAEPSPPIPQPPPDAKAPPVADPAHVLTTQLAASTPLVVPDAAISAAPDLPVATAKPFYKTWWFWTAAGVVAVGAGTATALAARGSASPPSTHLGSAPVY